MAETARGLAGDFFEFRARIQSHRYKILLLIIIILKTFDTKITLVIMFFTNHEL